MSNTSKKHRNRKIRNISLVVFIILLIGSFIISRQNQEIDPASFADLEVFALEDRVKGNPDSGLVLVEYSDFQCPACANAAPILDELVDNFGEQFALEYRHFPLRQNHPNAQLAAQAAESAGIQGKFWEMHDLLFERQTEWSRSPNPRGHFRVYAEELDLHLDRFQFDLESSDVKNRVDMHFDEAMSLGLPGTPAFVFNGEPVDLNEWIQTNIDPVVLTETDVVPEDEPETVESEDSAE